MIIGVLALQGDFEAHGRVLANLGVTYQYIYQSEQLRHIQGLIIPGGESTTMMKFLKDEHLLEAIQNFAHEGGHTFGTCAGAILLAKHVSHPAQESLGLVDIGIERNAYGRQVASHISQGSLELPNEPAQSLEMVFIRAPKITTIGEGVTIIAKQAGLPVGVMTDRCLLTTFHPELTKDTSVHKFFINQIAAS